MSLIKTYEDFQRLEKFTNVYKVKSGKLTKLIFIGTGTHNEPIIQLSFKNQFERVSEIDFYGNSNLIHKKEIVSWYTVWDSQEFGDLMIQQLKEKIKDVAEEYIGFRIKEVNLEFEEDYL